MFGGLHLCGNTDINARRTEPKACGEMWNMGKNTALVLEPSKTTEVIDRFLNMTLMQQIFEKLFPTSQ
jgi:hypothetical protein